MKHPALRVAAWRWIAPEFRLRIACAIVGALPALPFRPLRVELVGSMARGCGHVESDFDINFAAREWNEQVEWRRLWMDGRHRRLLMAALTPIMDELHIRIEAAPNNPDQCTYDITHDLIADTYTDPRNAFPDCTSRWWDGYALLWRSRPILSCAPAPSVDEWPVAEVSQWERVYGSRFLSNP